MALQPIPVEARCKDWVCCRSFADCGFESRWGHGCLLSVIRQKPLRRADHSSRRVLPSARARVCLCAYVRACVCVCVPVCDRAATITRDPGPKEAVEP